jgi:FkbM family methyltransferase
MTHNPPPIRELLQESVADVLKRERESLEALLARQHNQVVLFGAGGLGRSTLEELRGIGVEPLCFSDNDQRRWGTTIEGCEVLSPADAAARYGSKALFIITIWNAAHWYVESLEQLKALGCANISSYSPVYWRFASRFIPFLLNDYPHKLLESAASVLDAETLWADELSLNIYRSFLYWYSTGDASFMPGRSKDNSYFAPDLFSVTDKEVLVDCGAFDGDTVQELVVRVGDAFRKIYAVEADPISRGRLHAYLDAQSPSIRNKVQVLDCAISRERTKLRFEVTGGLGSKICSEGGVEVEGIPLDELFANAPMTMLKMDIEGAEFGALEGGRKVIERDRPILMICVYHTQSDIWRIPLLAHEMLPEHKLFLRSHGGDGFETVMYAIPAVRSLK